MDDQARLRSQIERLSGAIDSRREQMARTPTLNAGGNVRGRRRTSLRPYRHRSLVFTHAPTNPVRTVNETQTNVLENRRDRDQLSSPVECSTQAHEATDRTVATANIDANTEHPSTSKPFGTEKKSEPFSETRMTSPNTTLSNPSTSMPPDSSGSPSSSTEWVRKRSSKSMALMNAAVYHPYIKPPRRPVKIPHSRPSVPKKDNVRRGDRMGEVLVDGVVFVFDASGTKLVKKSSLASSNEHQNDDSQEGNTMDEPAKMQSFASSSLQSNTPLHASVNGTKYIRTKNGNLINQELVTARRLARNRMKTGTQVQTARNVLQQDGSRYVYQLITRPSATITRPASRKSRELCAYYTRSGVCRRGAQCPFLHDDTKRALCPGALKPSGYSSGSAKAPKDASGSSSELPESMPETDVLFVRDDVAAKLDPAPESMLTEGPGSALFAGQNDFISLDGEQEHDDHLEEPIHAEQTTKNNQDLREHLPETQSVSSACVSDDSMEYDSDTNAFETELDQDQDSDAVTSDKEVDQALGGL
ncbi:hypothetical protein MPSI1_003221 [Malassezia psittaci]|uniref:C3H1-type domain-containing protein n=1 Tax=Malassezia psittaci TaxID=1821823 RepID=A0AAF0F8C5_9BASI|nr:hypothetical protein MPSI1_003221 [Malassezia psittaci]